MDRNITFFEKPAEEIGGSPSCFHWLCCCEKATRLCGVSAGSSGARLSAWGSDKMSLPCRNSDTLYSTRNKRKTLWTGEAF